VGRHTRGRRKRSNLVVMERDILISPVDLPNRHTWFLYVLYHLREGKVKMQRIGKQYDLEKARSSGYKGLEIPFPLYEKEET